MPPEPGHPLVQRVTPHPGLLIKIIVPKVVTSNMLHVELYSKKQIPHQFIQRLD